MNKDLPKIIDVRHCPRAEQDKGNTTYLELGASTTQGKNDPPLPKFLSYRNYLQRELHKVLPSEFLRPDEQRTYRSEIRPDDYEVSIANVTSLNKKNIDFNNNSRNFVPRNDQKDFYIPNSNENSQYCPRQAQPPASHNGYRASGDQRDDVKQKNKLGQKVLNYDVMHGFKTVNRTSDLLQPRLAHKDDISAEMIHRKQQRASHGLPSPSNMPQHRQQSYRSNYKGVEYGPEILYANQLILQQRHEQLQQQEQQRLKENQQRQQNWLQHLQHSPNVTVPPNVVMNHSARPSYGNTPPEQSLHTRRMQEQFTRDIHELERFKQEQRCKQDQEKRRLNEEKLDKSLLHKRELEMRRLSDEMYQRPSSPPQMIVNKSVLALQQARLLDEARAAYTGLRRSNYPVNMPQLMPLPASHLPPTIESQSTFFDQRCNSAFSDTDSGRGSLSPSRTSFNLGNNERLVTKTSKVELLNANTSNPSLGMPLKRPKNPAKNPIHFPKDYAINPVKIEIVEEDSSYREPTKDCSDKNRSDISKPALPSASSLPLRTESVSSDSSLANLTGPIDRGLADTFPLIDRGFSEEEFILPKRTVSPEKLTNLDAWSESTVKEQKQQTQNIEPSSKVKRVKVTGTVDVTIPSVSDECPESKANAVMDSRRERLKSETVADLIIDESCTNAHTDKETNSSSEEINTSLTESKSLPTPKTSTSNGTGQVFYEACKRLVRRNTAPELSSSSPDNSHSSLTPDRDKSEDTSNQTQKRKLSQDCISLYDIDQIDKQDILEPQPKRKFTSRVNDASEQEVVDRLKRIKERIQKNLDSSKAKRKKSILLNPQQKSDYKCRPSWDSDLRSLVGPTKPVESVNRKIKKVDKKKRKEAKKLDKVRHFSV